MWEEDSAGLGTGAVRQRQQQEAHGSGLGESHTIDERKHTKSRFQKRETESWGLPIPSLRFG